MVMHSKFSEEDLPSNLISFYKALRGYTNDDVKRFCKPVSDTDAEIIWDRAKGMHENRNWHPIYRDWGRKHGGCCASEPKWPRQFDTVREAPKGDLWRDWKFRTDYYWPF